MILSQGDSRGWFVSVCKLPLLCIGLWSPTCEFTSQSKIICLLLFMFWNPAYFDVVAFLLQGHAEQRIVLTHHLVVFELICWNWSTISSYSLLADTCCSFCSREVFKPDQTNYWNLLKWIFFCLKWGIKWNSFYPILHSKKEVCYHWDFGSNSVTFCLFTSCPCDLPLHKILLSLHRDDRIWSFMLMTTSYPGKSGMRSGEQIAHVGF